MGYPYPSSYKPRFKHDLWGHELVWRDHYYFLLQRGYQLRPRYEPGWQGSWLSNGKKAIHCEDHHFIFKPVLDAVRVSDGIKVALKLVPTFTQEIPIGLYFSSDSLRLDPRNHCVPILDVVLMPTNDAFAFIAMPVLRRYSHPYFKKKLELMEAFYQMLEGIEFMHEHHVAHRDSCILNFLMDSSIIIPEGFHFAYSSTYDGIRDYVRPCKSREAAGPMKYYWIDFGLSSQFSSFDDRRFVVGLDSQERLPELSLYVPYDPFKVDIFQVGMCMKRTLEDYVGLDEFMQPLIDNLTERDPQLRPSASEALLKFKQFSEKLSNEELHKDLIDCISFRFNQTYKAVVENRKNSAWNKVVRRKLLRWMSSMGLIAVKIKTLTEPKLVNAVRLEEPKH